jgi:hypothetical protein
VHTFLADLLAASEPKAGTAAHDRWRLDCALQEIRAPGRENRALDELRELANGPLAGQIADAVAELTAAGRSLPPLPRQMARELRRTILSPIRSRAAGAPFSSWRRAPLPGWAATAAAFALAPLAALALPILSPAFTHEVLAQPVERYELRKIDAAGTGPFRLEVSGNAKWRKVPKILVGSKVSLPIEKLPSKLDLPEEHDEGDIARDPAEARETPRGQEGERQEC